MRLYLQIHDFRYDFMRNNKYKKLSFDREKELQEGGDQNDQANGTKRRIMLEIYCLFQESE
jgi:hypothetical protein